MLENELTQEDIKLILDKYSFRRTEFQKLTKESYRSKYIKGYVITVTEEVNPADGSKTGRIIASHTQEDGRIVFKDTWVRSKTGFPLFVARNLASQPLSDFQVYQELTAEIDRLNEQLRLLPVSPIPNARRAGRKHFDYKMQKKVHQFGKLYWEESDRILNLKDMNETQIMKEKNISRTRIMKEMNISKTTYYRFRNWEKETEKLIDGKIYYVL